MPAVSRSLAALAFAVALAGCATSASGGHTGPHQITILFSKDASLNRDCPLSVTVEPAKQCSSLFGKQVDCLDTKGGQQVIFVAEHADPRADGDLEFSIDFDPFKQGNNMFRGKKGQDLRLTLDPRSPPKEYTYNVFSGRCRVIDPKVIIRL